MTKYVTNLEDLPEGEFWVILKSTGIHHPAEGVWAPGHGYPEHTEHIVQVYQVFEEETEFKHELARAVEDRSAASMRVRGFKVSPYRTRTIVEVNP